MCETHDDAFPAPWPSAPDFSSASPGIRALYPRPYRRGGRLRELAGPKVTILGAIPDLARLFEQVRLTAAPLRYGAGIKGKVLDSFAAGLPCVMTPIAAEGLRLPAMLGQSIGTDTEALEAGLALIARDFTDRTVTKALHAAIQGLKPPDKTLAE